MEAVDSPYDLDNIHLEEVDSGVYADFELEYLLLEGAYRRVSVSVCACVSVSVCVSLPWMLDVCGGCVW